MVRPVILAFLSALMVAAPAAAQPETLLRLSETAERSVRADQLVAVLRAQATGGSAAAVQEQVNRTIAAALERARAVQGVTISTGSYWTYRSGERRDQWQASQEVRLTAIEAAPALLELVGALQGQGLTVSRLSYEVSRPVQKREREAVTAEALVGLKERAERLAEVMGMRFAGFREVRVDAGRFARPPMPAPMMAASADAARTPPTAEPADVPIAATVEGDAILHPR
jgi:predicted secreted protein